MVRKYVRPQEPAFVRALEAMRPWLGFGASVDSARHLSDIPESQFHRWTLIAKEQPDSAIGKMLTELEKVLERSSAAISQRDKAGRR